jgi:predicted SprT family Zn-dependent metalloprotease
MASKTFIVRHGSIRIKVKLLPTVADVHREYLKHNGIARCRDGKNAEAFTLRKSDKANEIGVVYLPEHGGDLFELIPHEVNHVVIHALNGVLSHDDEDAALAVGILSSRIFKRTRQMGVAI